MNFHIYGRLFKPSLFYEKTSCGHGYPGKIIYETEKEPELPHDIIKTYELELKNDFTVFEDGVKVGNWTNVYDQSFIVNYKNSVFYAHYRYFYDYDISYYNSNCDWTMNGWLTIKEYESNDNENQLMGCFIGEKIKEQNEKKEVEELSKSAPPKKKFNKKVLKNIKMKDLQIIVDEINNSNLTWKAKINPDDLDLSFYDYIKKYFGIKNKLFQDNDIEIEDDETFNNNEANSLRILEETKSIIEEIASGFKNLKKIDKSYFNNSINDSIPNNDDSLILLK